MAGVTELCFFPKKTEFSPVRLSLSARLMCIGTVFSLTANQPQPAYKPKKTAFRTGPLFFLN
jgi:hypothetical protein